VIRGTRIPVELLLRKLAEGAAVEDLLDAYPRLVADDIRRTDGFTRCDPDPVPTIPDIAPRGGFEAGE